MLINKTSSAWEANQNWTVSRGRGGGVVQSTESEGQEWAEGTAAGGHSLLQHGVCWRWGWGDPEVPHGLCLVCLFISFSKPLGLQRSLATEAKDQFRKVLSKAFLSSS